MRILYGLSPHGKPKTTKNYKKFTAETKNLFPYRLLLFLLTLIPSTMYWNVVALKPCLFSSGCNMLHVYIFNITIDQLRQRAGRQRTIIYHQWPKDLGCRTLTILQFQMLSSPDHRRLWAYLIQPRKQKRKWSVLRIWSSNNTVGK